MQPYFIPYIGYWQLINAVDKFVILDDVNYIIRGWINRNRILINGQPKYITIPLSGASKNKFINEINIIEDKKWKNNILKTVELNYKKAPYFKDVFDLLVSIIQFNSVNISVFNVNSIKVLSKYLSINTEIIDTSSIFDKNGLNGQNRILDICVRMQAGIYINPVGGVELYDSKLFKGKNIDLFFIRRRDEPYKQTKADEFVPNLSILDVLMNNSKEETIALLNCYELVST